MSSVNLVDCLSATLAFLERIAAPVETYGFFGGGNPHEFRPDEENSPEQHAAHRAACEAWARYEQPELSASALHSARSAAAEVAARGGSFGPGVYTYRDPEAVRLIAELKKLIAARAEEEAREAREAREAWARARARAEAATAPVPAPAHPPCAPTCPRHLARPSADGCGNLAADDLEHLVSLADVVVAEPPLLAWLAVGFFARSMVALVHQHRELAVAAGRVVDGYDASEGPAWPAVETLSRTLAGRR